MNATIKFKCVQIAQGEGDRFAKDATGDFVKGRNAGSEGETESCVVYGIKLERLHSENDVWRKRWHTIATDDITFSTVDSAVGKSFEIGKWYVVRIEEDAE